MHKMPSMREELSVGAIPLKGDFPPPVDKKLCAIRSAELRAWIQVSMRHLHQSMSCGNDRELFKRKNMSIYSKDKKFERYHKAWEHVRNYGSKEKMESNKQNVEGNPTAWHVKKAPTSSSTPTPVDWYPWGAKLLRKQKEKINPYSSQAVIPPVTGAMWWKKIIRGWRSSTIDERCFCQHKDRQGGAPRHRRNLHEGLLAMTGSGGWPLNIIMTPEKKPFFAATYLPKKSNFGRQGMMEIIPQIRDIWKRTGAGQKLLLQRSSRH